jgi:hypothetical protein
MSHVKWMKIYQFATMRRYLKKYGEYLESEGTKFKWPTVTYRAKVKLDGTNGGIHVKGKGKKDVFARFREVGGGERRLGEVRGSGRCGGLRRVR